METRSSCRNLAIPTNPGPGTPSPFSSDNRDATYVTSWPLVSLDRPGQRLVLAGVNHAATGTASYCNGARPRRGAAGSQAAARQLILMIGRASRRPRNDAPPPAPPARAPRQSR
jgi:hypothetical protein